MGKRNKSFKESIIKSDGGGRFVLNQAITDLDKVVLDDKVLKLTQEQAREFKEIIGKYSEAMNIISPIIAGDNTKTEANIDKAYTLILGEINTETIEEKSESICTYAKKLYDATPKDGINTDTGNYIEKSYDNCDEANKNLKTAAEDKKIDSYFRVVYYAYYTQYYCALGYYNIMMTNAS